MTQVVTDAQTAGNELADAVASQKDYQNFDELWGNIVAFAQRKNPMKHIQYAIDGVEGLASDLTIQSYRGQNGFVTTISSSKIKPASFEGLKTTAGDVKVSLMAVDGATNESEDTGVSVTVTSAIVAEGYGSANSVTVESVARPEIASAG